MLLRLLPKRIFNIWSYIARDHEEAADSVEQAIFAPCEFLAEAPLRGHSRSDLHIRGMRVFTTKWHDHKFPGFLTPS